jgi:hypothetical protein
MCGTYKFLVYADDICKLDTNINKTEKSTEALLAAAKEVGREVNTE